MTGAQYSGGNDAKYGYDSYNNGTYFHRSSSSSYSQGLGPQGGPYHNHYSTMDTSQISEEIRVLIPTAKLSAALACKTEIDNAANYAGSSASVSDDLNLSTYTNGNLGRASVEIVEPTKNLTLTSGHPLHAQLKTLSEARVTGPYTAKLNALGKLLEAVNFKEVPSSSNVTYVVVSGKDVGFLIGKGGMGVREMRKRADCSVEFLEEEADFRGKNYDRIVTLKGDLENRIRAAQEVMSRLDQLRLDTYYYLGYGKSYSENQGGGSNNWGSSSWSESNFECNFTTSKNFTKGHANQISHSRSNNSKNNNYSSNNYTITTTRNAGPGPPGNNNSIGMNQNGNTSTNSNPNSEYSGTNCNNSPVNFNSNPKLLTSSSDQLRQILVGSSDSNSYSCNNSDDLSQFSSLTESLTLPLLLPAEFVLQQMKPEKNFSLMSGFKFLAGRFHVSIRVPPREPDPVTGEVRVELEGPPVANSLAVHGIIEKLQEFRKGTSN